MCTMEYASESPASVASPHTPASPALYASPALSLATMSMLPTAAGLAAAVGLGYYISSGSRRRVSQLIQESNSSYREKEYDRSLCLLYTSPSPRD